LNVHQKFETRSQLLFASLLLLCFFGSLAFGCNGRRGNRHTRLIGKASIIRNGNSLPVKKGMEIFATDELITEKRTAVKIIFSDGGNFMAFEDSKVKISEYKFKSAGDKSSLKSVFDVAKGKVRFFVKPETGRTNETNFKTSNAVMGIRGTSGFIDASNPNNTQLVVLTGKVEVSNPKFPGQSVLVPPNQMTNVVAGKAPTPPKVAPPSLVAGLNAQAEKVDPNAGKGEKQAHDDKEKGDKKEGDKKEGDKKEGDKKEGDKKEGDKKEGDKNDEVKKEDGQADKKEANGSSGAQKEDKKSEQKGGDKDSPKNGEGNAPQKEGGASVEGKSDKSAEVSDRKASQNSDSKADVKPAIEEPKPVMMEKKTVFSPDGKNTLSVKNDSLNGMVTPAALNGQGSGIGGPTGNLSKETAAVNPVASVDVAKQVSSAVKANTDKLEETKAIQAAAEAPKVALPSSVKVKIKVNLPQGP
jgi:hypothetical protein